MILVGSGPPIHNRRGDVIASAHNTPVPGFYDFFGDSDLEISIVSSATQINGPLVSSDRARGCGTPFRYLCPRGERS